MSNVIGASITVRWRDDEAVESGKYVSFEGYNVLTQATESGISNDNVDFYVASKEALELMLTDDVKLGEWTIVSIDDWNIV